MKKVLVEVFVPTLEKSFDVFIPVGSPMYEVSELMKKAISDLSDGRFIANSDTTLCYKENGLILNINITVYELGIHNGSKLMLI